MATNTIDGTVQAIAWSATAGIGIGLIWAIAICSSRRRTFLTAGVPPTGQQVWFAFSFISMGCYVATISMLGFLAVSGALPYTAFWFLLLSSLAAFSTTLSFAGLPGTGLPEPMSFTPRFQAEPPRRTHGRPSWRPALILGATRRVERLPDQEPARL